MSALIVQGNALQIPLADKSVQCIVTSPPYYGLRDYGVAGQIGLEQTPAEYVAQLVAVFAECWRVLRDDGVVFLNLGDSYTSGGRSTHGTREGYKQETNRGSMAMQSLRPEMPEDLKPKDLLGIPWRVAFALQADGWYLRSDIIWAKPNPMPEGVTDRPTKSHEYMFLLSKSERYFYDAEAIEEPAAGNTDHDLTGPGYCAPGQTRQNGNRGKGNAKTFRGGGAYTNNRAMDNSAIVERDSHGNTENTSGTRNRRTVWTIATQPYPEAHFATYPPALVEPCILAGTSPQACEHCGAPWERDTETTRTFESGSGKAGHLPQGKNGVKLQGGGETGDIRRGPVTHVSTLGWRPTCACANNTGAGKCVVLDPFNGSGTTGAVALKHGRRYFGIELNSAYIALSHKRLAEVQPVLIPV